MNSTTCELSEVFGDPICIYSRAQAIADGVLVDLSAWGGPGPQGMLGGFIIPVAVTKAVWDDIQAVPAGSCQDVRGRAHDVLWMARLAVGSHTRASEIRYQVYLQVGRKKLQTYKVVIGPGDDSQPVLTIMNPDED
jgi:hypothetical protein